MQPLYIWSVSAIIIQCGHTLISLSSVMDRLCHLRTLWFVSAIEIQYGQTYSSLSSAVCELGSQTKTTDRTSPISGVVELSSGFIQSRLKRLSRCVRCWTRQRQAAVADPSLFSVLSPPAGLYLACARGDAGWCRLCCRNSDNSQHGPNTTSRAESTE